VPRYSVILVKCATISTHGSATVF